jgi:hypothetical protein
MRMYYKFDFFVDEDFIDTIKECKNVLSQTLEEAIEKVKKALWERGGNRFKNVSILSCELLAESELE